GDRLSRPPARRRDPSRGTDRGHRGRVRRPHYHASLPPRVFAAGSARADRPVPRALVGRGVQRLLHGAGSRRGLTPVAHPFGPPPPIPLSPARGGGMNGMSSRSWQVVSPLPKGGGEKGGGLGRSRPRADGARSCTASRRRRG